MTLKDFISSTIVLEQKIPTESNVNYRVTNKILEIFNYKKLDEEFKKPLDRLLKFRNAIAHGENSILVSSEDINQFCDLVRDLMNIILDHMKLYIDDKLYLERQVI